MSKEAIVIGIAGGTGSGKSTMVRRIQEEFGPAVALLSHDFYYKAHDELSYDERCLLNYDHPNSFDTDLMIRHIRSLRTGQAILRPVYDFTIHNRSLDSIPVEPAKVIIVEGILIFENRELRELCDIKLYIDTDADVRIIRRILRDVKKRGRTLESVVEQYLTTVKVMHEQFVEPSKKYADIIIPEGGRNEVALAMVNERIKRLLDTLDEQD
ncbi:MAG: uridine kinase [Eubacteriales bacterium]|jgi:uridine kinase|nr:uridine kinase [Eubacteriales bacterium]MDD3290326.1 uridine kinase [Eubacteriales bacterium]MDD3864558.1 uridine kinase [Eubacteriales bacterium]MDD4445888.1 uridine kinase [Eubacteriales bacterium]